MLLTLMATSLRPMLKAPKGAKPQLALMDLPKFARETLGLHGLNLSTDLLAGLKRAELEALRDRADRAGCACLTLVETEPQPLGDAADAPSAAAVERLQRVVQAAQLLGCNAVGVKAAGKDDPEVLQRTAQRLRPVVERAEKGEINVLISPTDGLTATPERVSELLKKVGGFRIGTMPDLQAAAASKDPVAYLRRLTPYASVLIASTVEFERAKAKGKDDAEAPMKHKTYDLEPLIGAVLSVGYEGTIALDYRGTGDATLGLVWSRRALERLLEDDSDLDQEQEPDEE